MRIYDLALFAHILGLVTLFGGFAVHQAAGVFLRRAASVEQIHLWLGLIRASKPLYPTGSVLLLLSGLHMSLDRWSLTLPWVVVPLVALVALSILGPVLQGRGYGAIAAAAAGAPAGPLSPELAWSVLHRGPWVALCALNGAAVGLVWVMTAKQGWVASVTGVLAPACLGAALGVLLVRSAARHATEAAQQEQLARL